MDTSTYIPNKSKTISVAQIKALPSNERQGIIISPGEWAVFEEGTPQEVKKPKIGISLAGISYEWILNQTTNERLIEEIGSSDTDKWVGTIVKLLIDTRGEYEYITATVIQKPEDKAIKEEE